MSTLTFEVPEEQAERLEEAARDEGLPIDALLRKLADEYLDRKCPRSESLAELVSRITPENRHEEVPVVSFSNPH